MTRITRIVKWQEGAESLLHTDLTTVATTPADIDRLWHADLTELCRTQNAIGLAANQVGVKQNFFFVAGGAKLLPTSLGQICICPGWEPRRASRRKPMVEGCKSLDGAYVVERWLAIDVVWTSMNGHRIERALKGLAAQVFQHEHDHLCGITLMDSGRKIEPDSAL